VPVSVQVRDGEDLAHALHRFRRLVHQDLATPWDRRRYGYYEKPSALRRKRRRREPPIKLGLEAQWARTGPTNAVGR
jgi:ribosomal protein S21